MDITKEIKGINEGNVEDVIKELQDKKKEIYEKLHISQVMQIGKYIDKLCEDNTFKKLNAVNMKIHYYYEPDVGNVINFDLLKKDDSKVYISKNLSQDLITSFSKLNNILFNLQDFSTSYVNEKFSEGQKFQFKIESGVGSKIMELLLSNEFLSLIKYNEMQMELNSNNQGISKQPKL